MSLGYGIALMFLLVELAVFAATIFALVRVIAKAGYSGWYVLLSLVPLVNIVALFIFAFSKWPIEQRLEAAQRYSSPSGPDGPYGWGGRSRGTVPPFGGPPFGGPPFGGPPFGGPPFGGPPFGGPQAPAGPRSWDQFSPP